MRASPVKLKHYHFTQLSITPVEGFSPDLEADEPYPSFSNAQFGAAVRMAESDDGRDLFILRVHLTGEPKKEKVFPYRFAIEAEAVLACSSPDDTRTQRDLVAVNGAALLYSAMREVLLNLTFRFPHGPMLLPSVHFLELKAGLSPTSEPSTAVQEPEAKSQPARKKVAVRQTPRTASPQEKAAGKS